MAKTVDGFDFAAATLTAMIGQRANLDDRLTALATRMRKFNMRQSEDRLTAAIIIESESKKCGQADGEFLLEAAAIIRRGP